MKRRLLLRMVLGYILFGLLGFITISIFTSHYNQTYLENETASVLHKESNSIAKTFGENYYSSEITLEEFQQQISALSSYLNADIYIVSTTGRILVNSISFVEPDKTETINGFDILDFGNDYYYVSDFYKKYGEDMICVYTPVTRNYKVNSYVIICQTLSQVTNIKYDLLNGAYLTLFILFLFSLVILLIFGLTIYRPLNSVVKAASSYAGGDFKTSIDLHRSDEIGFLADTMNYMALELNSLENDQHKFISNISHDFRSPLTSIKGYAQAMADGTIPVEMQEKYLNVIIFETERLEKLTQSLLELNKYGTKGIFLDLSVFDLNELIKRTILSFEGRSKEKLLTFELILTGEKLFVKADASKIDQVLHNLIDNAVKFSNSNSTIVIETTARSGKVFVSVKDSGIGIPRDSLNKIWERFYKTDLSRGKDKKGTGLGLSIVKEIIHAHHENINVISTEGIGTEFIFTLTLAENPAL